MKKYLRLSRAILTFIMYLYNYNGHCQCNTELWNHTYVEARNDIAGNPIRFHQLITVKSCVEVEGTIQGSPKPNFEIDGDFAFNIKLSDGYENILNTYIDMNEGTCEAINHYYPDAGNSSQCVIKRFKKNDIVKCEIVCADTNYIKYDKYLIKEKCRNCPVVDRSFITAGGERTITGRLVWDESHFEIHPVSSITDNTKY